eukprot:47696-Eustigmatos_ZCMA.PRE.1
MLGLEVQEKLFALVKEKSVDAYRNVALLRPDEHGSLLLGLVTTEGRWDWRDKLQRAQRIELHDLQTFQRQ